MILVLVRDLLFSTKITATARAGNIDVKVIRDPARLASEAGEMLIVDLNQSEAIDAAAAWKNARGCAVIGFVSHVDKETILAARAKGIDRVMPRSQFVEQLPELLKSAAM